MAENNLTASKNNEFDQYLNIPSIIMSIVGVASNSLLLVAFIKDPLKCFRNSGTYLVMNLSVSDCLMNLVCLVTNIALRFAISSHQMLFFFFILLACVSCVSITSISIDRFLMVAFPIKHRILMRCKIMILWIAAIWITCCAITLFRISDIRETSGRQAICSLGVIIIILSAVMYLSTYYKLKKKSRNIALQNSIENRSQALRILKEKRFLKTIIITASMAFVCTVPYFVLDLFVNSCVNISLHSTILYEAFTFVFQLNFAVNPLIYILRLPSYRKTFYAIYCKRITASN